MELKFALLALLSAPTAAEPRPRNMWLKLSDSARLKSAVTRAKSECDFVVVTMHAGIEYTRTPNSEQVAFAHLAIDDGADMVIGAHPHWIQTIERYCTNLPLPNSWERVPR